MPKSVESLSLSQLEEKAWHVLSVSKLIKMGNPLRAWCELERPITRRDVLQCVKEGRAALLETPLWSRLLCTPEHLRQSPETLRDNHIRKVAYFVLNEASAPIHLDVGVPSMGCFVDNVVEDGNHRLAGAWIADRPTINANVSGSVNHAIEIGLWNPNEHQRELSRRQDAPSRPVRRPRSCP